MAKRLKRNSRGSKYSDALHWRVVKERMIVRSWERCLDPSRARDSHRYAGGSDRLEEQTARNLLIEALAKSRDVVREAERSGHLALRSANTGSADGGSRHGYIVCGYNKCWGCCQIQYYRSTLLAGSFQEHVVFLSV
jgi:hypothetical protein